LFFIYTDGITEARDRENKQYGMAKLTSFFEKYLSQNSIGDVVSLSKAIVNELDDYTGYHKTTDDVTFVVARSNLSTEPTEPERKPAIQVRQLDAESPDKGTG
jgi:serine phosphatase RsbU (regulator of sigma subunit)